MMNVFWVLAYDNYYPAPGLGNVKAAFDTREAAEEYAKNFKGYDNVEIADITYLLGISDSVDK